MVGARLRKIIERRAGSLNDVPGNEPRAFCRSLLSALDATFPFEDRPAVEIILRQRGKDAGEVHLPIAARTKTSRPVDPRRISAVDALSTTGTKLRLFHVKHLDALV